jgi:autotransporter-associated beta strand protein
MMTVGIFAFVATQAQADKTWDEGTDLLWNTAANWSPDTVPTTAERARFNSVQTPSGTIDLGAGATVRNITFDNNIGGAVTLGTSSAQTLYNHNQGGDFTMGTGPAVTIAAKVVLHNTHAFVNNNASGGNLYNLSGGISKTNNTANYDNVNLRGTGDFLVDGVIDEGGGSGRIGLIRNSAFPITDTGFLTLSNAASTFNGRIQIIAGDFESSVAGSMGNSSQLAVGTSIATIKHNHTGQLRWHASTTGEDSEIRIESPYIWTLDNDFTADAGNMRGSTIFTGTLDLGGATRAINGASISINSPAQIQGDITNSGAVAGINITQHVLLSGNNTYDGTTTANTDSYLIYLNSDAKGPGTASASQERGGIGFRFGNPGNYTVQDAIDLHGNSLAGFTMPDGGSVIFDLSNGGDVSVPNDLTKNCGGIIAIGGNTLTLSGDLDFDASSSNNLKVDGGSTLVLSGNNTNSSGNVAVSSGATLIVESNQNFFANQVGTARRVSVSSGGSLEIRNDESTVFTQPSGGTLNNTLSINASTLLVGPTVGGSGSGNTITLDHIYPAGIVTITSEAGYALVVDEITSGSAGYTMTPLIDMSVTGLYTSVGSKWNVAAGKTATISAPTTVNNTLTVSAMAGTLLLEGDITYNNSKYIRVENNSTTGGKLIINGTLTPNDTSTDERVELESGTLGGTGYIKAVVDMKTSSTLDFTDGVVSGMTISNLIMHQTANTFGKKFKFDFGTGATGPDVLTIQGTVTRNNNNASNNKIQFTNLGAAPDNGTYLLMDGLVAGGPQTTEFILAFDSLGGKDYLLQDNGFDLEVVVSSAAAGPASPIWDGSDNDSWVTAGNWVGDAVPTFNSEVQIYQTGAGNLLQDMDQSWDIESLNFTADAIANVNIDGTTTEQLILNATNAGAIGLSAATPSSGSPVWNLQMPVVLAKDQTWFIDTGAHVRKLTGSEPISEISAGTSLTKTGGGRLDFNDGDIEISGSYIASGGDTWFFTSPSLQGDLVVNAGATVSFQAAWNPGTQPTITINGGTLVQNLCCTANNDFYVSAVTMTAGTISQSSNGKYMDFFNNGVSSGGSIPFTTLASSSEATLSADVETRSGIGWNFTIADGTTASGVDLRSTGQIDADPASTGIAKNGAGLMRVEGTNLYTSATTVNAGTFQIGGSGNLVASGGIVINGGILSFDVSGAAIVQGTGFGTLSGSGGTHQTLSGNVTMNAANTFSGVTRVDGGTLDIDTAYFDDTVGEVRLVTGGILNLDFVGIDDLNELYLDEIPGAVGIWGRVGGGAANQTALITGDGQLRTASAGGFPGPVLTLTGTTVTEAQAVGTFVGFLSTLYTNSTFSYSLVAGDGDTGNGNFQISGSNLQTAVILDYETDTSHSIRVRSTETGGGSLELTNSFTVFVLNEIETWGGVYANAEAHAGQELVGTLQSLPGDNTSVSYSIEPGFDGTLFMTIGDKLYYADTPKVVGEVHYVTVKATGNPLGDTNTLLIKVTVLFGGEGLIFLIR